MLLRHMTCLALALLVLGNSNVGEAQEGRTYTYTRTDSVTYDFVGRFSEGLAGVRLDGKEFHIRTDGSRVEE